jgi:hypothetical protein
MPTDPSSSERLFVAWQMFGLLPLARGKSALTRLWARRVLKVLYVAYWETPRASPTTHRAIRAETIIRQLCRCSWASPQSVARFLDGYARGGIVDGVVIELSNAKAGQRPQGQG